MDELFERRLNSETIFDGRVVHLFYDTVELPNGHTTTREYIRHSGAVAVLPLTEDGEAVMVRQYRYPFARVLLEVPAGKLDPGETPDEAVRRELSEETGAEAAHLTYLGEYFPTVAYSDEVIHLYLARGLTFFDMHTDEDEFLRVSRIPLDALVDEVMAGRVPDGKTQTLVLRAWALQNRRNPSDCALK